MQGGEAAEPCGDAVAPVQVLAFCLPQFHRICENDDWWGSRFTGWRNVLMGRPLVRGPSQRLRDRSLPAVALPEPHPGVGHNVGW